MSDSSATEDGVVWRPDLPDSAADGFLIALALGAIGPGLAWILAQAVGLVSSAAGVPAVVSGLLALAAIVVVPYVAFAGLGLAYLLTRGMDWSTIRAYLGFDWPGLRDVLVVVGGWATILVLVFVAAAIVQLVGTDPAQNRTVEQAMEVPEVILLLIPVMFVVVGPTEEILYRGVVQGRLREVMGPVPAIAIASGIFAAAHVLALTGGITGRATTIALLFIPALVLGAVYEYTENLVVPIVLHGLHNSFLLAILYVVLRFAPEGGFEQTTATLLPALPV